VWSGKLTVDIWATSGTLAWFAKGRIASVWAWTTALTSGNVLYICEMFSHATPHLKFVPPLNE
jgi:hypothetical protein